MAEETENEVNGGRHDAIRTGISLSFVGRDRINALCSQFAVSQGGLYEALALFVPEEVVATAVADFKASKERRREGRSKVRSMLNDLSEKDLAALLELARAKT